MLPCHSQVSGIIEYWNGLPKNQFKYIFDSSSLISSWCIYLHKAVWSLYVAVLRKGPSLLIHFLVSDSDDLLLFYHLGFLPDHSWA